MRGAPLVDYTTSSSLSKEAHVRVAGEKSSKWFQNRSVSVRIWPARSGSSAGLELACQADTRAELASD